MKPTITKEQAESLAVNYESYLVANRAQNMLGLHFWGSGLKTIQQETGITLIDNEDIDHWLNQPVKVTRQP